MWTVSAVQMHTRALIVCDEDATLELRVKTVRYFKGLEEVHLKLLNREFTGHTTAPAPAAGTTSQ